MSGTTSSARGVLQGIGEVIKRTALYSSSAGKVEVERLFLLDTGFEDFLAAASSTGDFTCGPPVQQQDTFFDLNHGSRWLLAESDHYVRLREQRSCDGVYLGGELKVAYPGLSSNPNARPAVDHPLAEGEVGRWRDVLAVFGLDPERCYTKRRVPFVSTAKFDGLTVELEADRFADDRDNRLLAGSAFVSVSVEVPGSDHPLGESALGRALAALRSHGIRLVECGGNYESYFYGRLPLPSPGGSS
jgi:hypothetical protein